MTLSTNKKDISLNTYFETNIPIIEEKLNECLSFNLNDLRNDLEKAMKHSVLAKAKRIRPILTIASYEMFESEITPILPLACAIELIHSYSLIHDDLPAMDNDDFRRGQLTCHKKFGEDTAILAGDTLNTFGFELVARECPKYFNPISVLESIVYLGKALGIEGMSGGQMLDLKHQNTNFNANSLDTIHKLKTGAMLNACVVIPAILTNQNKETIASLNTFGNHLGKLFQIIDDILDATQSKEILGKTPQKDEKNKKLTYVTLYGLEEANKLANEEENKAMVSLDSLPYNTKRLKEILSFVKTRLN